MQPIRQIGIPLDHIDAELAAYPFASEAALRLGLMSLDPQVAGDTRELWREAERSTVGHSPGFSIDEVVAIRDRRWFGNGSSKYPLHRYLTELAKEVLESHGHEAVPRLPACLESTTGASASRLAQARRCWRWLSFALPPDLLLAAAFHPAAHAGSSYPAATDPEPDSINLLSPALEQHLQDLGFAEIHLHLGAGLEFPLLWVRALHCIGSPELESRVFASPGAALDEGRQLAHWLVRAALARYVLAAYLRWGIRRGDFSTFLTTTLPSRLRLAAVPPGYAGLETALRELASGDVRFRREDFVPLQNLYSVLIDLPRTDWSKVVDGEGLLALDPVATLMPAPPSGGPSPEIRFVRRSLGHLYRMEKEGTPDLFFARLFWQTIRVRVLFYRHVTQRPMTPGLQWFVRFYGRISAGRGKMPVSLQWKLAADLGGRGRGLRSLEARCCPAEDVNAVVRSLDEIDKVQLEWAKTTPAGPPAHRRGPVEQRPLELGLVLHFSKQRGGNANAGAPVANWRTSNADPGPEPASGTNPTGYRFARYYSKQLAVARVVARAIRTYPLSLQFVRGVDLCTDELGVPNWVFVRILNLIREAGHAASGLVRAHTGAVLPTLRTTIHAGEDFVHLLTGLRYVDETIDQLDLREGDRIGHGVALGVDPNEWARRAGRVAMCLEDRLFDLVWEWAWYSKNHSVPGVDRFAGIQHEIGELSSQLFGKPVRPLKLHQLQQDLADPDRLAAVGFPNEGLRPIQLYRQPSEFKKKRAKLLQKYLTSRPLFSRSRQVIWVDATCEGEVLARLQSHLRAKLGVRSIVVEVNPTSNLLIGNLEDLTSHPIWRLKPPIRQEYDSPPVGVCIGSDDPVTFNSNLRQEYQCLLDAMLLSGQVSDDQATQWLEQARRCALDHRFTIPRVDDRPLKTFMHISTDSLAPY